MLLEREIGEAHRQRLANDARRHRARHALRTSLAARLRHVADRLEPDVASHRAAYDH